MELFGAIKAGGIAAYILVFIGILGLSLIIERIFVFFSYTKIDKELFDMIESYNFDIKAFSDKLYSVNEKNVFNRFFRVIVKNKDNPVWWIESRANDEAQNISVFLSRGTWILDTIVTAAPLIGLLGTVIGMIDAFNIIGTSGIVEPKEVTGGVAKALVSTALGLLDAIIGLFGFNYISKKQLEILEELERLGTRLIDHIRIEKEGKK